jgi:hypothetical protein
MSNKINLNNASIEELLKIKRGMEIKQAQLAAAVETRSKQLQAPAGAVKYMRNLASGDALTINNVIWPFFFNVATDVLAAGGGQQTVSFEVTQEAAFVFTEMIKVVYAVDFDDPTPTIEYINPRDISGNGDANGLRVAFVDGSSSRAFMDNYVPLDIMGAPFQPFIPDRPLMFMPLQQLQVEVVNQNPNRDFVAFMIFKGYRIRLENQQDLINLVTG